MSVSNVIIRSDLENIISMPSDLYENSLQQELEELILIDSENESENEIHSISLNGDESDEDVIVMNEDTAIYSDRKYVHLNDINSQSSSKITLYLTEEEQGIINNCTDPKLKQLLLLNRTKAVHIKEMCKKLHRLYDELGTNIRKEREKFHQEENVKENAELQSMAKTYIWRIGMPFFKDKSFYSAPANRDLATKKENNEFFATKIAEGRKWTTEDQQILKDSVLGNYFKHRLSRAELDVRLLKAHIRKTMDEVEKSELIVQLGILEAKLDEIKSTKNEPPPLNCEEGIDWFKIANFDLKARHTILGCKSFWNIYLHPLINKTDWLPEENEKIKELALEYNYDWDVIAKELNTNRSPYLVCVHYNTKLCDKFKRQRFLPEEDEFLMEVVENCRLGDYIPWGRVAYYFEDRSKHQLYHRYRYYLSCKNIKKGTFTEAEDILLTNLAERCGKDFSRISELMPQRTSIQLRNRYSNYLEKITIQLGNFTYEDDKKILNHVEEHGHKSWSILAKDMKRTRAHVRQRYLTLRKCMEKYPHLTIDSLPRRQQSFFARCQAIRSSRMATCLEKLKKLDGIPTLATVEMFVKQMDRSAKQKEAQWRVLKAPVRKTRSEIDKKLIEFFKGSCKFQRETKLLDERSVMDSARRVIKLLDALGADENLLKEGEAADVSFMLNHDEETLKCIKKVLQGNNSKLGKNSFILETAQPKSAPVPGPSHLDPLEIDLPKHPVKHLLPPTVNSVLGLRGMIIKYQIYKAANRNFTGVVKTESTKVGPEDPMVWKIQQKLLECDVFTKARIQNERELFYRRFWAVLKWPCIISKHFPEHLTTIEEENQEEEKEDDIIEQQQEKRRVGRPHKKAYTKVLKMVEAKKRKRVESNIDECKNADETIVESPTTQNTEVSETKPKKSKRGRPPNKCKSEHAVAYIPRRSYVKVNKANQKVTKKEEEMNVDDPDHGTNESINDSRRISTRINQNKNKAVPSPTVQKVINVSDIKFLGCSNAIIVDKDKINNLIKLNKIQNAQKIIVLQETNQKLTVNGKNISPTKKKTPDDASHTLQLTEFQQEVVVETTPSEVLNQNPSSSTVYQKEIYTINQKKLNESHQNGPVKKTFIKHVYFPENGDSHFQQFGVDQNPSTSTPDQDDSLYESDTESHQNAYLSDLSDVEPIQSQKFKTKQNSQMICINKQQWIEYCKKWKNLHLPETEKEMLEQDLHQIEEEAVVTGSEINIEQNGHDRNLHTTCEIKTENAWQESDVEIDNISEDLSEGLNPFREYRRVINDSDDCNKEVNTAIESNIKKNTLKLSATIQRMREKIQQGLNHS